MNEINYAELIGHIILIDEDGVLCVPSSDFKKPRDGIIEFEIKNPDSGVEYNVHITVDEK